MEKILKSPSFQHIKEKIFLSLDLENVLNCRLVCSDWKQLLDNPKTWILNYPRYHPLAAGTILAKTISNLIESLEDPKSKSKLGVLLSELYFIRCNGGSRIRCKPNHSYLIWPLVIAFKKQKKISMVKEILSKVGNSNYFKLGTDYKSSHHCCYSQPKNYVQSASNLGYLEIVKVLLEVSEIPIKYLSEALRFVKSGHPEILVVLFKQMKKTLSVSWDEMFANNDFNEMFHYVVNRRKKDVVKMLTHEDFKHEFRDHVISVISCSVYLE